MTEELPAPLVPPEVDLSGLDGFILHVEHLLSSELLALGTPDECWAAFLLWCRAWKQKPPASLPDDDRVLASFAGCKTARAWTKVKPMAMRGFVKCSDDRLYHRFLSAVACDAWDRRVDFEESSGNKTSRQKRWRERLKHLAERLRALGVTPPAGASLQALETLLSTALSSTPVDAETSTSVGAVDVSGDGREIGCNRSEVNGIEQKPNPNPSNPDHRQQLDPPASALSAATAVCDLEKATKRGVMSAALRAEGVDVTSQDPHLVAWVDADITPEFALQAVLKARTSKPKPEVVYARYLDTTIRNMLKPAKPIAKDVKHGNFGAQDYHSGVGPDGSF